MLRLSLLVTILLPLATSSALAQTLPNTPIPSLDIARYSGPWHEIAHLPLFFQRNCVDQITATYTPRADGQIGVRNACRARNSSMDVAQGVAKRVDASSGALKVRFAPDWLSWLPMVWADYWVIELDPDYQWAVVGSPSRKYLWVLSRSPAMDRTVFARLRDHAEQRGYDVSKLVMSAPLH